MVAAWQVKAVKDGLKSLLPFPAALRRIRRAVVPYATDRSNDSGLCQDVAQQIQALQALGISVEHADVVEIGTGWTPVLPILFSLAGARRVITLDQERLLDTRTLRHAIGLVLDRAPDLAGVLGSRGQGGLAALASLREAMDGPLRHAGLHQILAELRIDYRAPFDVLHLPRAFADLIVSRDVFEHIPEDALRAILLHAQDVLREGGAMCHTIDMSDHWEHRDKSISRVNFLRYGGPLWTLAGLNPQNFQNRLRRSEFKKLFSDAGFDILQATGEPDPRALAALRHLPLCRRYRSFAAAELAVLSTRLIAVKPPRAPEVPSQQPAAGAGRTSRIIFPPALAEKPLYEWASFLPIAVARCLSKIPVLDLFDWKRAEWTMEVRQYLGALQAATRQSPSGWARIVCERDKLR